jgi:hypothetical protein
MVMRLTVIVVFFALAGCALVTGPAGVSTDRGPLPASTRPVYNLSGYPPAFKDGYVDGCETAKGSSYGFKDERRYVADNQYRMGWSDGFDICRGKRGLF